MHPGLQLPIETNVEKDREVSVHKPVVFTHIPKTAGLTFANGLRTIFDPADGCTAFNDISDDVTELLPRADSVRFVAGHIRFPTAFPLFGPSLYMAALRDPIDRLVSHYFYLVREKGIEPPEKLGGLRRGFDVFYANIIAAAGRRNLQCRFFANDARAATAIRVISLHYALVWDSARTSEVWPIADSLIRSHVGQDLDTSGSTGKALENAHIAPVSSNPAGSEIGDRPPDYRAFLGAEACARLLADNAEDQKRSSGCSRETAFSSMTPAGAHRDFAGIATADSSNSGVPAWRARLRVLAPVTVGDSRCRRRASDRLWLSLGTWRGTESVRRSSGTARSREAPSQIHALLARTQPGSRCA